MSCLAMKTIAAILFCGISFWLQGDDLNSIHCKNIESAITQFSSTMTNDIRLMDYDFIAILEEIKDLKSREMRINFLTNLANRLCAVSKDIWKYKNAYSFQGKKVYLMGMAMRSFDDENLMFKWRRYTDLLQAMKTELALYGDVKDPDAYRDRWIALAKEDLIRRINEAGTNKNIIIRRTMPISKEEREANAKWSYKRRLIFDIDRYEKRYFDSLVLQDDYRKLPKEEQKILIEMVREGLGRYPKWYREDSVEKK